MHSEIRKYFDEDCPFYLGVSLYLRTGGPYAPAYFQNFLSAPWIPDDVDEALQSALTQWMEDNPEQANAPASVPVNLPVPDTASAPAPQKAEPPKILELRQKAKLLHKEHSNVKGVHNHMCANKEDYSDEERYEVSERIMQHIVPQLDDIYDQIREWQDTGKLPEQTTTGIQQETIKQMQRVYSLRPRISKLPKLIEKASGERKKQLEKELLEKQEELSDLCRKLDL